MSYNDGGSDRRTSSRRVSQGAPQSPRAGGKMRHSNIMNPASLPNLSSSTATTASSSGPPKGTAVIDLDRRDADKPQVKLPKPPPGGYEKYNTSKSPMQAGYRAIKALVKDVLGKDQVQRGSYKEENKVMKESRRSRTNPVTKSKTIVDLNE